jgi:hypothetical protein
MQKISAAKKLVAELNKSDLSAVDRSLLISAVLNKVAAIPLRDIIVLNEQGTLFVNGREVKDAELMSLRESADSLLHNKAFRLIREQAVYATFVQAAHRSGNIEELIFGKAALFWGNLEDAYIKMLLGQKP